MAKQFTILKLRRRFETLKRRNNIRLNNSRIQTKNQIINNMINSGQLTTKIDIDRAFNNLFL